MFNLQNILEKLKNVDLEKNWWVVISWFDKNNNLLFVKWIIFSDKKRKENLETLFNQYILPNKKINTLIVDFVENLEEVNDAKKLKDLDLKKYWVFIWDTKNDEWVFILPNTKWIENFATAYKAIKEKITFSSPNVNVYIFTTNRTILD